VKRHSSYDCGGIRELRIVMSTSSIGTSMKYRGEEKNERKQERRKLLERVAGERLRE